MKRAWTEEGITAKGSGYEVLGHTAKPNPDQKPHPPIWVGGNSKRAIRRAVDLGDGWMPMVTPAKLAARRRSAAIETLDDLESRLGYLREYASEVGRTAPREIVFLALLPGHGHPDYDKNAFIDHVAAQAELGVTTVQTNVYARSRAELLDGIAAFGSDVLSQVAETTL